MAMISEYDALPDDRGLSLPLETKSTKCEASNFLVELQNGQNIEDKFRNFQKIIEHIKIMINNEERKGLFSDGKTLIEQFIQSTDINVLHAVIKNSSITFSEKNPPLCLFCLIAYHVLVASEKENSTQILNVIKGCLQTLKFVYSFNLDDDDVDGLLISGYVFQLYLDMYYTDNPNEIFTNIQTIWELDPTTELELKLTYCKKLMKAKDYKTLIQLIHHHADYFKDSFEVAIESQLCIESTTTTMVLFHILHHQVSINKMEKVKRIETILSRILKYRCCGTHFPLDGFYDFILTLDNIQILGIPYLIKLLQHRMKENPYDFMKTILLCSNRLRQAHHYTECIKFIKCHFQFILSFPTDKLKIQGECYYRQQYCITLLLLLDEYVTCHDTHKMNLVLAKLLVLRVSFLSDMHSNSCYCFMGNQECLTTMINSPLSAHRPPTYATDFKLRLLDCYHCIQNGIKIPQRISTFFRNRHTLLSERIKEKKCLEFNLVMNKVIQGELELAPFLHSIINMDMKKYKDESPVFFMELIKISADHNIAALYNILKMLCAFDLQPEIQDLILQGLTAYFMISFNRQYGILSKFILDISMICPKGQFSQKLTLGMAKLLLKFDNDDDTVNDFRKIIYKCYCTVRHDSKNEKDTNIEKYKDHYTFIASMESEEEMKKLKALTNFLLMLTIFLITSGGHHKSAELKKYLSLKYEYRDSILFLLWCSGDVEINPGPTHFTLRKLDDSEKERNWIYDMCSILVTLIKYKSFDNKNGGMWKEKPLHWPTDCLFYNPRNKPKGPGYSIGTDKKLLECLEEHCYVEGVFKETTHFDDEHTKLKVKQYQKEIIAWKNNRTELFELYILRQELDALIAAKGSLYKYRKDPEFNLCLYDIHAELIFYSEEDSNGSKKSYTDIVRDIATTFCRIDKGLNYLEKSPGIWKTPPEGWNPCHLYYDPCNDKKGRDKGQDDKLVDNLLTYCESKNITIPSELQPLLKAWKQRNTLEITKYYTIWSKTAIIDHSLKYLELEDMLGKIHVQESLKQIGVILDTQCWRCPSVKKSCTSDNGDKSQDSGFSDDLHSSHSSDIETNSTAKVASLQINSDNPCMQFPDSTQTNLNDIPASPHSLVSHTDGHLCNIAPDRQNQWNQSSKHTCMNSFKYGLSILTGKAQPEADGKHHPISSVNSSNSNEQLITCIVHIHDATSKPEKKNNKISKTAKKRSRQKNYESCSEPKRLHISDEDISLLLNILTSPSENGKDLLNTTPKGNSKDGSVRTIIPNHLSHDLISIKSRPNLSPSEKQTDQLIINELPDTADDKPVDSSSCKQADNANKKWETTSDQCVNQIVNRLEEIEQDYSASVVEPSSGHSSSHRSRDGEVDNADINIQTTSDYYEDEMFDLFKELDPEYKSATLEAQKLSPCPSTDQPSDYNDGFPEHVESIIDELLNINGTHNTFNE
ncbi:uncharacterized protein LOC127711317 [Mytilus californianus]|uniref:uncharacterized protein LOC127711317 n=1 Tax=Mytilus californianus TaxID=6549 RepID=UPI002247F09F|nr:uncharacterized protein LOC127711317 [Mytilus californianus]